MSATFYKMKSKIYRIRGKVNPTWRNLLVNNPRYAVKVDVSNTHIIKELVVISDGTYCYFESQPQKYYELVEAISFKKEYWEQVHKDQGTFKLHF